LPGVKKELEIRGARELSYRRRNLTLSVVARSFPAFSAL